MMTTRSARRSLLSLMTLLLVLPIALAAQEAEVTISTQPLGDNVFMLSGYGGNIGVLIGEDGTFLVDHQGADYGQKIQEAINTIGGGPVKYLVNTHFHHDHTGGNEYLKESGAIILAHSKVRERLMSGTTISYFQVERPPYGPEWLPEVVIENSFSMHLNNEAITAFHVGPAHSDGDVVVYFNGANVVHVGDIFFNKMYPFIDLDNGGNFDGLIKAIDNILARINEHTKVIPGHGPASNYAGLKAYRDMLATIVQRVQAMIDEGKSAEEVILAKPSAEFDEANQGFIPADDFVKFVYDDLSK